MPQAITQESIRAWLKPRPTDCHKGDFGNVAILGGAPGMAGAALLAARAALWLGAGRVYAGLLDDRIGFDPLAPEIMLCSPERALAVGAPACLVVGPGIGLSAAARGWVESALASPWPLILDADALNLVAAGPDLAASLRERASPTLLTPHPGEAGRLLEQDTQAIQSDRLGAIERLVARFQCSVALKGAGTLVRFPEGPTWRNDTGNPGMAAPGMGDVLAGMIGALRAQGLTLDQAARAGVHLHGAAGDAAVKGGMGPVGLAAGEVARAARGLLNAWLT
jgi:hydroxyethylthiazole kinase-like uncharacterized protein yjeF